MNVFEKFISYEKKYNVETIMTKRWQLWPYLRVYIGSRSVFSQDRTYTVSSPLALKLLGYLFYGFRNWFRKYDAVFVSVSNQRKFIDGKWYDRCDFINQNDLLVIEKPRSIHHKRKSVPTKHIVSQASFYLLEKLIMPFTRAGSILNEDELKKVLKELDISFNYRKYVRKFKTQYRIYQLFFKIYKPKKLYIINSYINMPMVKAAKDRNITVIELQHGVLNKTHYAYNLCKPFDKSFYPDYLLSFGLQEKETFDSDNNFISPDRVFPVGSFSIDMVNRRFSPNDRLSKIIVNYKCSVAITSQDAYEDQIVPFVKKMADLSPEILFVFIPRNRNKNDYDSFKEIDNILFVDWLNTYEIIKHCNYHSTMTSTCAIEAISLGVVNVLMDIEGKSSAYYKPVLNKLNYTYYGKTPEECIDLYKSIPHEDSMKIMESNRKQIIPGFKENMCAWAKV